MDTSETTLPGSAPEGLNLGPAPVLDQQFVQLELDVIHPAASGQAREHFDDQKIATLAESIRSHGVQEPIIVRSDPTGGYEIVAGERRWRAARRAGLATIPALVRSTLAGNDVETLLSQVAENVHRENLNPLEEAKALQAIMDRTGRPLDAAAKELGKSLRQARSLLKILSGPEVIQQHLLANRIELRAAEEFVRIFRAYQKRDPDKALARLARVLERAERDGLSLRQLEAIESERKAPAGSEKEQAQNAGQTAPGTAERQLASSAGQASPPDATAPDEAAPESGKVLFVKDVRSLTIDLDVLYKGTLGAEDRASLITILNDVITRLRRS